MIDDIKPKIRPHLTTRSLMPENQETPLHFLRQWVFPNEFFYNRNHFPYPKLESDFFSISIEGKVDNPVVLSYKELKEMPSKVIIIPLECSGNRRSYFKQKAFGEQWRDGAVTQLAWKGVQLADILAEAGISSEAVEVVFEGHDYGKEPDMEGVENFARSLPISKALHPDTIIAYELNGEEIPFEHGYPLRLIVPQWYAMASVKWLKKISVIDDKFEGHFQAVDYVYYPNKENDEGKTPVTTINVTSIIQQPINMQSLEQGSHIIDGMAWTGEGKIDKVEVSFDEGKSWSEATIKECGCQPYSWVLWYYSWNPEKSGEYTIMSRAWDTEGRVQLMEAQWNRKGYGYNAIYMIKVKIE